MTTAVASVVFLVPLGWELRNDHRDQAMSAAERDTATVAGAIAAGAGKKGVDAAIAAAGGRPVVHAPGDFDSLLQVADRFVSLPEPGIAERQVSVK